ncbi:hypothetical protein M422DRAFT_266126, partial [Sphaerobolus stellatus SS14]
MPPERDRPKAAAFLGDSDDEATIEQLRAAGVTYNLKNPRKRNDASQVGKKSQERPQTASPSKKRKAAKKPSPSSSEDDLDDVVAVISPSPPSSRPLKGFTRVSDSEPEPEPDPNDIVDFPPEGEYYNELEDDGVTPFSLIYEADIEAEYKTDCKPLRYLYDFVIYDSETHKQVPLSYYVDGENTCEAFGFVVAQLVPHLDDDDSDDEEDDNDQDIFDRGTNFKTTCIFREMQEVDSDDIIVETQYAFYSLKKPCTSYAALYRAHYLKEMSLRYVLRQTMKKKNVSLDQLVSQLNFNCNDHNPILERSWTKQDIIDNFKYTEEQFQDAVAAYSEVSYDHIRSAPIIKSLLPSIQSIPKKRSNNQRKTLAERSPQKAPAKRSRKAAPVRRKKREKKRKVGTTTVTPLIHALISQHFDTEFKVVGQAPGFLDVEALSLSEPKRTDNRNFVPQAGNFVYVNEGDHYDDSNIRIAQVVQVTRAGKEFHARWFIRGNKTVLEEITLGQEIFLSLDDKCRTISTDCIVGQCKVKRITLAQHARQDWPSANTYFYSSAWNRKYPGDFIEVTDAQVQLGLHCETCSKRDEPISTFLSAKHSQIRDNQIRCREYSEIPFREYHEHDFISYEVPASEQLTCSIGQIVRFKYGDPEIRIEVRKLGREADMEGVGRGDENALFLTEVTDFVDARQVLGKVHVVHFEQYCQRNHDGTPAKDLKWMEDNPDCFFIASQAKSLDTKKTPLRRLDPNEFNNCDECDGFFYDYYRRLTRCKSEVVLKAFDPFVGVGGLGLGLSKGCSMKTVLGVEIDPSA